MLVHAHKVLSTFLILYQNGITDLCCKELKMVCEANPI